MRADLRRKTLDDFADVDLEAAGGVARCYDPNAGHQGACEAGHLMSAARCSPWPMLLGSAAMLSLVFRQADDKRTILGAVAQAVALCIDSTVRHL